jgi:hypothetical protein
LGALFDDESGGGEMAADVCGAAENELFAGEDVAFDGAVDLCDRHLITALVTCAPVLTMSVPSVEMTLPEKCPSIRSIDLKQTSPVKFTTSPTKPSQLSLLTFVRLPLTSVGWPRSSLLVTA